MKNKKPIFPMTYEGLVKSRYQRYIEEYFGALAMKEKGHKESVEDFFEYRGRSLEILNDILHDSKLEHLLGSWYTIKERMEFEGMFDHYKVYLMEKAKEVGVN